MKNHFQILTIALCVSGIPTESLFAQNATPKGSADDLETTVKMMTRIGSCFGASFAPNGKRVAFISDLSGLPQAWTVPVEGGWPTLLATFDDPVSSVDWSPKGDWLALAVAPGGGMNRQIFLVRPDGTGLQRITEGGKENNWLGGWSHDGTSLMVSSNRGGSVGMNAYVYEIATRKLTLVAKNSGIGYLTDLSRAGKQAVLYRMVSRSNNNLFLVDRDSGKDQLLTEHDGPGTFWGGRFAPDGKTIYLSSNKDRDLLAFAGITLTNGKPGAIETLAERSDAELQDFQITEDGKTIALVWNAAGRSELAFFDTAMRKSKPGPQLPAEIVGDMAFSRDGRYLALTLLGSAAPSDVWLLDRQTGKLRQLTHSPHAGVDLSKMVKPELVHFKAHDGLELSGWLYRPPGVTKPGAVVLKFHGGPEGQERPWFAGGVQAMMLRQIAVFAPNIRGSSGFGKKFVNLDNGPLRFNAVKDIKACVEYLVTNKIADPKRIGITGGSYGGYMVMAGLTEYPELFAAGVNLFGIVNFETFFEHTEPWMAAISTIEYGDPKTQKKLLQELSPIHKLDRIKAPTLVIHGANDTNVPVIEAEQVAKELKNRNIPVKYILFPDEGHGFQKIGNRIEANVATVRWFEEHLKKE